MAAFLDIDNWFDRPRVPKSKNPAIGAYMQRNQQNHTSSFSKPSRIVSSKLNEFSRANSFLFKCKCVYKNGILIVFCHFIWQPVMDIIHKLNINCKPVEKFSKFHKCPPTVSIQLAWLQRVWKNLRKFCESMMASTNISLDIQSPILRGCFLIKFNSSNHIPTKPSQTRIQCVL